jgi:hypothetical protein
MQWRLDAGPNRHAGSQLRAAQPTPSEPGTSRPEGTARISLPVEPGSTVEGLVEVNGHQPNCPVLHGLG